MSFENSDSSAHANSVGSAEDDFYVGAAGRIPRFMVALGLFFTAVAGWKFGHSSAIGVFVGSVISFLNFHWLKSGVSGLADRVTNSGKAQSGQGIVGRFLLRYVLMGVAAYGILTSFPASLRGLFAGLFLPVGAIICEAAYEMYAAMTRKN